MVLRVNNAIQLFTLRLGFRANPVASHPRHWPATAKGT